MIRRVGGGQGGRGVREGGREGRDKVGFYATKSLSFYWHGPTHLE